MWVLAPIRPVVPASTAGPAAAAVHVGGSGGKVLKREASRGETKCKHAGVEKHADDVVTLQVAAARERQQGETRKTRLSMMLCDRRPPGAGRGLVHDS